MIYLYGLTDIPEENVRAALADCEGLAGPLEFAAAGSWTLIHSPHPDPEVPPKRRLMLAHTRVLERLIDLGTVLPARFGLLAGSLDEALALIHAQAERVRDQFDRVRGCREIGVRVSFARDIALKAALAHDAQLAQERLRLAHMGPEAHFAMAAFGGKLADHLDRRRAAAQKALLKGLAPFVRAHVLRRPETDTEVLRAEFLVEEQQQELLLSEVSRQAAKLDFAPGADPQITVIAPVPMYHFVRLSLSPEPETEIA